MEQLAHAWAWISAHPAEAALALYAFLTGLVGVYRANEHAIKDRVKRTETHADDWLVSVFDKVASVFEVLALFVPHAVGKPRAPKASSASSGAVTVLVLVCMASPSFVGCGATAAQQHEALNTITDIADPSYGLAVDACDNLRDVILARTGSTYERDHADMVQVNDVCDRVVAGFEALRIAQLSARAAIDEGAAGVLEQAMQSVLDLWHELQVLVPEIRSLDLGGAP